VIEMCIAFPGLVVAVDSDGAIIETEGRRRRASTLFLTDIAIGDWVTVAAGTVVERLEPDQAAGIQTLLRAAITAARDSTKEGASDVHTP
jgi:hydrogenase assembly chaperone HypC/HupF